MGRFSDRFEMNSVKRTRLRSTGIEARARVIRAEGWTGHSENGGETFNVRELVLMVHPPGGEPYEVTYVGGVAARIAGGYCAPGADVPVRIDPDDPERVVVDVKRAKAEMEGLLDGLDRMTARHENALRKQAPTGHADDLKALEDLDREFPD